MTSGRSACQIRLPQIGVQGQELLAKSRVLVVGIGGLGCAAAEYLALAGVGTLGLVDGDVVDTTNLHRQILYDTSQVGRRKVDAAMQRLRAQCDAHIELHAHMLDDSNAQKVISRYDVILDCTDSIDARYTINDACILLRKPLVYGSAQAFEGQCAVFLHQGGPCYRCLVPKRPSSVTSCSETGVLGPVPGLIGTLQAIEALKIILGLPAVLSGKLFTYSALKDSMPVYAIPKQSACVCVQGITPARSPEIESSEVRTLLEKDSRLFLIDVREKEEWDDAHIEGAIFLPLSALQEGRFGILDTLGKDTPLILYCHSGRRSLTALDILKKKGYADVRSMRGGIVEWESK